MRSRELLLLFSLTSLALCQPALARGIRLDLSSAGNPNTWLGPIPSSPGPVSASDGPLGSGLLYLDPSGVTTSTSLDEFAAVGLPDVSNDSLGQSTTYIYTDNSNTGGTPPLLPGSAVNFDNGIMYNWGPSGSPFAQVVIYSVTDDGTAGNVLCDDADATAYANDIAGGGGPNSSGYAGCASLTPNVNTNIWEVQFNYASDPCTQLGATLSFAGLTYKNDNPKGNPTDGLCNDTFVFVQKGNGAIELYNDAVPAGWEPVPLPATWLLLASALAGLLLFGMPARRGLLTGSAADAA